MGTVNLHRTYQPGNYYCDFSALPAPAQKRLRKAKGEIENSSYTVYRNAGFMRAKVFVNRQWFNAEISLGDLNSDEVGPDDEDDEAQNTLDEVVATLEIENTTVYLTEVY